MPFKNEKFCEMMVDWRLDTGRALVYIMHEAYSINILPKYFFLNLTLISYRTTVFNERNIQATSKFYGISERNPEPLNLKKRGSNVIVATWIWAGILLTPVVSVLNVFGHFFLISKKTYVSLFYFSCQQNDIFMKQSGN